MLRALHRKLPPWGLLAVALVLQTLLIFRAFGSLLTEPDAYLLEGGYDGMKNYFTFLAYLQQPFSQGLSWFGQLNYPFGDYLFYTDNTPLLAVLVKLFSHYVYDLTPHALVVYHSLLLSGLLLSTALLVRILRRLLPYDGLVIVFSLVLVWINPQTERLLVGHFNLSFSWVVLFAIWSLLRVYERATTNRPLLTPTVLAVVGLTLAAFVHLYYLAIVGLCTGVFFGLWLITSGLWRKRTVVAAGLAITLLPPLLSLAVVRSIDAYYKLRVVDATGFDYGPWKLQFSALFQSPTYNSVHFIIELAEPVTYESRAYLGAFALFGLVIGLGLVLVRREAVRHWWHLWRPTWQYRFLLLLLGAGLAGLFTALGTRYYLADEQFVIRNYLSVFFYLRKVLDQVSQFRAVARFNWTFFWAVNLLLLAALGQWLQTGRGWSRWVAAAGLLLLTLLDTRDALKHYRHARVPNILTNTAYQPELTQLVAGLNPAAYQAILPIPYFHVGSEDPTVILDDDDAHATHAFQLALRTRLPLMASKMSRTPPVHARLLRSLFTAQGPDAELLRQLGNKPVLVFFDQRYYDSNEFAARQLNEANRQILQNGLTFTQHLRLVAEAGKLRLYQWDVPPPGEAGW